MNFMTPDVTILLVEDNPLDAKATLKAAKRLNITNQIVHVTDGQAALDFLRTRSDSQHSKNLVLLDLNLPGKDGHDVLREMQADRSLRSIPVVVLTSSEDRRDIATAYELGANAYVAKPVGLDGWLNALGRIEGFWLSLAKIPAR